MNLAERIERSAALKRDMVAFALQPRFDRERRQLLRAQFGNRLDVAEEEELVNALDGFLLEHPLKGGATVVEKFVSSRTDLSEQERDLLLGWRDVVQGIFEVQRREGDAVILENLVDELTYQAYSNMGPSIFTPLGPGSFIIGRIVPIESAWLVSGSLAYFSTTARATMYSLACEAAMKYPEAVFRNPEKLARARELVAAEHSRFVEFFGADFVTIPGPLLTDRMRAFYGYDRDQAEGDGPVGAFEYPPSLTESELVAVIHDDNDGLGLYGEFASVAAMFADPGLLDRPAHRRHLRDYLDDDTVPPTVFDGLVARDPDRGNEVFRKLLGHKGFDWKVHGNALMRRRKAHYFEGPRLPGMVPISTKLAPYAKSG